jgi:hypothetical protein
MDKRKEFGFQLSWTTAHLCPHFPIQPSSRNINHDKKNVKDNRKSLMAVKKALEKLKVPEME